MRQSLQPPSGRQSGLAFTLLEMLVSVTILTFIIFGLYAMFNQTQKAFHSSIVQVDVTESGRAAVDLLIRELAQVKATRFPGYVNLRFNPNASSGPLSVVNVAGATSLFALNDQPTVQDLFFVTQAGNTWNGVGYFIDRAGTSSEDTNAYRAGVGTLYRFSAIATNLSTANDTNRNLVYAFDQSKPAQYQRITDGVLHLRVRALDSLGREIQAPLPVPSPYSATNIFAGNELPAFLDLEVAIMEPKILAEAKSKVTVANIQNFLSTSRAGGAIHLFRQRIALPAAQQ